MQTTLDIADDEELISLMVQAGINTTFIGIETPSEESIDECNKVQNKNRDMLQCVKKIQKAENRLTIEATGSNTDYTMNFIPKMDSQELLEGYKTIIHNIYSAKPYYKRIRQFLINYKPANKGQSRIEWYYLSAFFKSVYTIGIMNKGRREYWKFFAWTILNRPGLFLDASMFTINGYHFRKVYRL